MRTRLLLSLITLILMGAPQAIAESYRFDQEKSTVSFEIGHFTGTAKGEFKEFQGTLDFFPDQPQNSKVKLTIQVASIDTGSVKRDTHLQQDDYFDAVKFPTITFESKGFKKRGNQYVVTGPLTMHGVEKNITLQVKLKRSQDQWAVDGKALFFSSGYELNRLDYGIEAGRPAVGDEVTIELKINAIED